MRIDASKISKLNERAVRSLLRKLITKLDDLDLALCVCVLCGQTWNEGAATLPICFS